MQEDEEENVTEWKKWYNSYFSSDTIRVIKAKITQPKSAGQMRHA
jgi:hypothetical protein